MFQLDGNPSIIVDSNGTNSLIELSVIFSAGDLADGDHQLYATIMPLAHDGRVTLSYVECVDPL